MLLEIYTNIQLKKSRLERGTVWIIFRRLHQPFFEHECAGICQVLYKFPGITTQPEIHSNRIFTPTGYALQPEIHSNRIYIPTGNLAQPDIRPHRKSSPTGYGFFA